LRIGGRYVVAALFGSALFGLLAAAGPAAPPAPPGADGASADERIEVRVRAVVASEDGELNAVLLAPEEGEPLLPVFVERAEADAIVARLTEEEDGVPHPAEALRSAIGSLGGKVERAWLDSLEPLASEGRLFLKQNDRSFELPAAGALCIELSIAEEVPLLVDRVTLDKLGVTKEELDRMKEDAPAEPDEPTPEQEPADPAPSAPPEPPEPGAGERIPL
jgi:bifunctional DNase/RNase